MGLDGGILPSTWDLAYKQTIVASGARNPNGCRASRGRRGGACKEDAAAEPVRCRERSRCLGVYLTHTAAAAIAPRAVKALPPGLLPADAHDMVHLLLPARQGHGRLRGGAAGVRAGPRNGHAHHVALRRVRQLHALGAMRTGRRAAPLLGSVAAGPQQRCPARLPALRASAKHSALQILT